MYNSYITTKISMKYFKLKLVRLCKKYNFLNASKSERFDIEGSYFKRKITYITYFIINF